MADQNGNGNGRIDRAAESALLKLVARWAMVVTLPLGGYIGAMVLTKVDKTSESATRLEEKVSALIDRQIPDIKASFDSRFNAQADRITRHDLRLDRIEDRVFVPKATP